jgi:hypothetical protein
MRTKAVAAVLCVSLMTGVGASAREAAPARKGAVVAVPKTGLMEQGRFRWNFEAVLHRTFLDWSVLSMRYLPKRAAVDFSCGGYCGPKSRYQVFDFIFTNARSTKFHVSRRTAFAGSFGNYRAQILVRGHPVACNARETEFLFEFRDSAAFSVGCSKPPA